MKNKERLQLVRGALIMRGTTLFHWGNARGYHRTTVHQAVTGDRKGRLAKKILTELAQTIPMSSPQSQIANRKSKIPTSPSVESAQSVVKK